MSSATKRSVRSLESTVRGLPYLRTFWAALIADRTRINVDDGAVTSVPVAALRPHPLLEDWIPPLDPSEYAALVDDVRTHGVINPIQVVANGGGYHILDGHHRRKAALEAGIGRVPVRVFEGLDGTAQLEQGVRANTSRRHLSRKQKRGIVRRLLIRMPERSDRQLAELAGVSHPTVAAVRRELEESGAMEKVTNRVTADGRRYPADRPGADSEGPGQADGRDPVAELHRLIASGRRFGAIYADPPWRYDNRSSRGAAEDHYATMDLGDLLDLPVRELAAEEAHLHLWTTNSFLPDALELVSAWGFEYRGLFIWAKPNLGTGNYWRTAHELLVLGIRGGARFRDRAQRSWQEWPRGRHSEKPPAVAKLIEKVSPGPWIELFGRQQREGWTVWGDEVRSVVE